MDIDEIINWSTTNKMILNESKTKSMLNIKAKFFRLSRDVVTCDVDRDVSTVYCKSSSGDEVDSSCVMLLLFHYPY